MIILKMSYMSDLMAKFSPFRFLHWQAKDFCSINHFLDALKRELDGITILVDTFSKYHVYYVFLNQKNIMVFKEVPSLSGNIYQFKLLDASLWGAYENVNILVRFGCA